MSRPQLVLLPSPLLGPAVWRPVAQQLAQREYPPVVVTVPADATTPEQVLRGYLDALPPDGDIILIPHSNAGLYVPAISAQRAAAGYLFVDAGLPPAGASEVPVASPAAYEFLRERMDPNEVLPVWTEWWDEADLGGLFPSADVRDEVEREQRRMPLSYFDQTVPVPDGWDTRPGAYLAFGDTYAAERAAASERGWPVETLPGRHLHMLVDPAAVTGAMLALLRSLT